MNDLTPLPDAAVAPTREDVERYQACLAQALESGTAPPPNIRTRHHFAQGLYCRELWRAAGTQIAGKVHTREHLYMVIEGSVMVAGEGMAPTRFDAPAILVSKPGTKRAVLALTDATCVTVHSVADLASPTDLDAIEAALIEPDSSALFDARNERKPPAIEGEAIEVLP